MPQAPLTGVPDLGMVAGLLCWRRAATGWHGLSNRRAKATFHLYHSDAGDATADQPLRQQ